MDKEERILHDWALHFFRNRDLFYKKIREIKENEFGFQIVYKDKTQQVVILKSLADYERIKPSIDEENKVIVTFNTEKNLQALLDSWSHLASQRFLAVYFINPESTAEKVWTIFPYNHDRIADPESLSRGIRSIFETVDPLADSQLRRLEPIKPAD